MARKTLEMLTEAKLDLDKMKAMSKALSKLFDQSGAAALLFQADLHDYVPRYERILKQMDERGDLSSYDVGELKQMLSWAKSASGEDAKKLAEVEKYKASVERMGELIAKQEETDKAEARKLKKAALNKSLLRKGSFVHAFKGGKEISGKIMWAGPDKYKPGQLVYGISAGGPKLTYVSETHIYDVVAGEAPRRRISDDDLYDAQRDMNLELGAPKGTRRSRAEIERHFSGGGED